MTEQLLFFNEVAKLLLLVSKFWYKFRHINNVQGSSHQSHRTLRRRVAISQIYRCYYFC
ncbi:MAG: hypothetical protein CLLPBCKN_002770 [Chroococcidiopsis cubana SAG 39.79]|nr:hypothetical protein [Chroococcidiopsis cubana SAG 39.79]